MKRTIAIISDCASPIAHSEEALTNEQNVYVLETAKRLSEQGYEIDIFTRRCSPRQPEILDWIEGVRFIHIPAGPPNELSTKDLLRLMPQFTSYMIRFFKQKSYDLVHAHSYLAGLVALNLKRTNETPFVVSFHNLGRIECRETKFEEASSARCEIEDRIVRNADRVIAKSIQEKTDLMYLYDTMPEKISIVLRGIDLLETEMVDEQDAVAPQITWQTTAGQLAAIYEEIIAANAPAVALRVALQKYTGKLSTRTEIPNLSAPLEALTDNQKRISLSQ